MDLRSFKTIDLIKLDDLLSENILAVQIWDNIGIVDAIDNLIANIINVVHSHHIPILINNRFQFLDSFDFDGVHFDAIPPQWNEIKERLRDKIVGITCTNELNKIQWADAHHIDYISYCSMFPSINNSRCDLVDKNLIKEVQEKFKTPFFLAGGIHPDNISLLRGLR